jgi:hypothetical protein
MESMMTYAASTKNVTAKMRNARRSRSSLALPRSCQMTTDAAKASMEESKPIPMSAIEPATMPDPTAMTASNEVPGDRQILQAQGASLQDGCVRRTH